MILPIVAAALLSSVLAVRSADFIAEGFLTNSVAAPSAATGDAIQSSAYRFRATVTNGCWHLLVQSLRHSSPADFREHVAYYDGTHTHFLDIWHANGTKVREHGESEKGIVLSNGSMAMEPLLWAFGGGEFLKHHQQGDSLQYGRKQRAQRAEWEVFADEMGAPRQLRLLSLGRLPAATPGGAERRHAPPFDQGFVQGVFTMLEATKSGDIHLPLRFVRESFLPLKGGMTTNDLKLAWRGSGFVTNVIPVRR